MIHTALLIAIMSIATILLRFLPFLIFDHNERIPAYILYLGKVLPAAMIGMLVVYCLKDTVILSAPYGIPELCALCTVAFLQVWKRNSLMSILAGTFLYMILIQIL